METIKMYFGEVVKFVSEYPYFIPYVFFAIVAFVVTYFYFKERRKNIDLGSKVFWKDLIIKIMIDAFWDIMWEKEENIKNLRSSWKDKNLTISKQKKRILELELACLFMEDAGVKDLAKNLTMFRKMTIKELENEKWSWKWSKIIKTKLEKNK